MDGGAALRLRQGRRLEQRARLAQGDARVGELARRPKPARRSAVPRASTGRAEPGGQGRGRHGVAEKRWREDEERRQQEALGQQRDECLLRAVAAQGELVVQGELLAFGRVTAARELRQALSQVRYHPLDQAVGHGVDGARFVPWRDAPARRRRGKPCQNAPDGEQARGERQAREEEDDQRAEQQLDGRHQPGEAAREHGHLERLAGSEDAAQQAPGFLG